MPKKKKYSFYYCRDCEMDFLIPGGTFKNGVSCPSCGDSIYTDYIKGIWLERPFNYKRPWTEEEDELILMGVRQGYKHREIAESLDGRTPKAVTRRLQQIRAKQREALES